MSELPEELRAQVSELSVEQLEELGEALLDFEELVDLENWLNQLQRLRQQVLQQLEAQLGQEAEQWESGIAAQVRGLGVSQLASLGNALIEFTKTTGLVDWLQAQTDDS